MISLTPYSAESIRKMALVTPQKSAGRVNLHPGQIVEGKVLKSLSPGIFLVAVSGKHIRVVSDMPLPKNALLTLMVSGGKSQVTFRLMDIHPPGSYSVNSGAIRGALSQNLWENLAAISAGGNGLSGDQSKKLASLLGKLSRITVEQPGAPGVRAFIQDAGLAWENKLVQALSSTKTTPAALTRLMAEDVKGMLSKILADAGEGAASLKGLYHALENIQLLNLHAGQETGKLFVPIPLQFQDGTWGLAQILFFLPSYYEADTSRQKTDSDRKPGCSVTLVMTLPRLGTVRAELILTGMALQVTLRVDQPHTLETIETQLPFLTQMLESRGIEIDHFTCQLMTTSDPGTDLITEMISQEGSSVCFVA